MYVLLKACWLHGVEKAPFCGSDLRLSFMLSDVIEASVCGLLGKEVWVFKRLSSCHKS